MVSSYLFQSEMSDVTSELKNVDKCIRANLVNDTVIELVEYKIKNGGRVPRGEVNKHLDDVKRVCPTILELCSCIDLVCLVKMMNVV